VLDLGQTQYLSAGGTQFLKRPRSPFFSPYQPPTDLSLDRPQASTVPSCVFLLLVGVAPQNPVVALLQGVGIDTIGIDGGHVALTSAAHRSLLSAGAFVLENLANVANVPPTGGFALALSMKVRNGSGAPTRVVAFID